MKKIKGFAAAIALLALSSSCIAQDKPLSREQEIQYNSEWASLKLAALLKEEKQIASLAVKEIALLVAAGGVNHLFTETAKLGRHTPQQSQFVLSIVLYRLAILAQTANMQAVTLCHIKEAQNLENMSKGMTPNIPNCRSDAYGADVQIRAMTEINKPSWASKNELINKWVVDVFGYAEAVAIIDQFGQAKSSNKK